MHYRVTNNAKDGPRGVNLPHGQTHYVPMGATSPPLPIAEAEAQAMRDHAPWFALEEVSDAAAIAATKPQPPSPDDAGKINQPPVDPGAANMAVAERALAAGGTEDVSTVAPDFAAMSDDALRAYLTDAGVRFHPNTGHDKLVAKALDAYAGELDAANAIDPDDITV